MLFRGNYNITWGWVSLLTCPRANGLFSGTWKICRFGMCGPALGFNIGEDRIAQLNGFQLLDSLGGNLVRGFKAPPDVEQGAELFKMRVEALFRVVARRLGGD